jgi:hypothetical protein
LSVKLYQKKKSTCFEYERFGFCRFGNECRYEHFEVEVISGKIAGEKKHKVSSVKPKKSEKPETDYFRKAILGEEYKKIVKVSPVDKILVKPKKAVMKPKPEAVKVVKPVHSIKKAPKIPEVKPKPAPKFLKVLKEPKKIYDDDWTSVSTTSSMPKIKKTLPEDLMKQEVSLNMARLHEDLSIIK